MSGKYVDAGRIVNTHGIRGEVKIVPWCDSADFLRRYKTLYIDGKPMEVVSSRVHKDNLLAQLRGVEDVNAAMVLKNKVVQIDKTEVPLPDGRHFIDDIIGLTAVDSETGAELGKVTDVLTLPANDVYVVRGEREYLIPNVPVFVLKTDVEAGTVTIKMQEGLATDEN